MGDEFEEEGEGAGEEEPPAAAAAAAAPAAAQPPAASPAQVQAAAEARLPPEPAGSGGVRIGAACDGGGVVRAWALGWCRCSAERGTASHAGCEAAV